MVKPKPETLCWPTRDAVLGHRSENSGGWFRVRTKRSIAWRSQQDADRPMVYNSGRDAGAPGLADPGAEPAGDREAAWHEAAWHGGTWNEEPS